jgi:hypothetical protein
MNFQRRLLSFPIVILFSIAGFTAFAQTPASFSGPRAYLGYDAAVGDFTGDGIPDLATVDQTTNVVHIHSGRGDGTFAYDHAIALTLGGAGAQNFLLATADLNHDGLADLVVGVRVPSGGMLVQTLFGKAGGGFTPSASFTKTALFATFYLADINNDGRPDLVATDTSEVGVLLGNGDGTFQPELAAFGQANGQNVDIAIGDFNGDGNPDLAITVTDGVFVMFGDGSGRFPSGTTFPTTETFGPIAAADLNRDGNQDLVLETASKNLVEVLPGNGRGGFGTPVVYYIGAAADYPVNGLAIGDVNGDGILDIVTANPAVLIGKGDGTFAPPVLYPANPYWLNVQLADLRGIGRLDLLGATPYNGTGAPSTTVLLNTDAGQFQDGENFPLSLGGTQCMAVADFNGDGHDDVAVGLGGKVALLLGTGKPKPAFTQTAVTLPIASGFCPFAGDFNNDGIPDLLARVGGGSLIFLAGHGDGTFAPPVVTKQNLNLLAIADFNGDGSLDVAGITGSSGIQVLLGNGAGNFSAWVSFPNVPGSSIAAADLNGDGKPDLLITDGNPPQFTVYLNQGGSVFQPHVYPLPARFSPGNPLVADVNRDGIPDIVFLGFPQSYVFLGQGGGVFKQFSEVAVSGNSGAVADFNGDGFPDLVVVDQFEAKVFLGTGTGTFVSPTNPDGVWFAPPGPGAIVAAYLQSQTPSSGLADLVTVGTSAEGTYASVLINGNVK